MLQFFVKYVKLVLVCLLTVTNKFNLNIVVLKIKAKAIFVAKYLVFNHKIKSFYVLKLS